MQHHHLFEFLIRDLRDLRVAKSVHVFLLICILLKDVTAIEDEEKETNGVQPCKI